VASQHSSIKAKSSLPPERVDFIVSIQPTDVNYCEERAKLLAKDKTSILESRFPFEVEQPRLHKRKQFKNVQRDSRRKVASQAWRVREQVIQIEAARKREEDRRIRSWRQKIDKSLETLPSSDT
jgi:hypothetical protein